MMGKSNKIPEEAMWKANYICIYANDMTSFQVSEFGWVAGIVMISLDPIRKHPR